jgi:hypothetical protein
MAFKSFDYRWDFILSNRTFIKKLARIDFFLLKANILLQITVSQYSCGIRNIIMVLTYINIHFIDIYVIWYLHCWRFLWIFEFFQLIIWLRHFRVIFVESQLIRKILFNFYYFIVVIIVLNLIILLSIS